MLNLHIDLLHRRPFLKIARGIVYRQRDNRVLFQNLLDKTVHMNLLDFQVGFKKLRELLLLSDFCNAKFRNLILRLAIHHRDKLLADLRSDVSPRFVVAAFHFQDEPSVSLEIHDDAIGNSPLAAGSPNLTFRQQYGIVTEEKLEVVNDNLLNLFFGLELNLGIECACGSEEHGEASLHYLGINSIYFPKSNRNFINSCL